MGKIDTETIKERIDLRELAGRYSALRKISASAMAGPCPKCGGDDRFTAKADSFQCRRCHEQWGDAIEFLQWREGLSFTEAVEQLSPGALPEPAERRAPEKRAPERKQQSAEWQQEAEFQVSRCQAALWKSEPAAAYLEGRGLEPHTWLAYGLGFDDSVPLPGTKGKERRPAIVIPWRLSSGRLVALRYRFLETHHYTTAEGRSTSTKLTALAGSVFSGYLYGAQGLLGGAEGLRTLVVCEGEINALSVWQIAHDTGVDVLSLGSEGQRLSEAMIKRLKQWRTVLTWADEREVAEQLAQALPGAYAITSKGADGLKQDANDLLKAGKLGEALSFWRYKALERAEDAERRIEGLLWDLWDAGATLQGLDAGTARFVGLLAEKLRKPAPLYEPEPGRWIQPFEVIRQGAPMQDKCASVAAPA